MGVVGEASVDWFVMRTSFPVNFWRGYCRERCQITPGGLMNPEILFSVSFRGGDRLGGMHGHR